MLSAYERGKVKPTLETVERLLVALDCDLPDLTRALRLVDTLRPPEEPAAETEPWERETEASRAEKRAYQELLAAHQRWLGKLRRVAYEGPPRAAGGDVAAGT